MTPTGKLGSSSRPVRIAIIGAGPSGFYAAGALLRQKEAHVSIDLFDRLPTPYGLVRYGVAPDHQKIKSVTRIYERTMKDSRVRYFGNVDLGTDITHAELKSHYDQIVYAGWSPIRQEARHSRRRPEGQLFRHRVCGLVQRPSRLSPLRVRPQRGECLCDRRRQCGDGCNPHPGEIG